MIPKYNYVRHGASVPVADIGRVLRRQAARARVGQVPQQLPELRLRLRVLGRDGPRRQCLGRALFLAL